MAKRAWLAQPQSAYEIPPASAGASPTVAVVAPFDDRAAVTDLGTGVNFAADLGASAITIGASQPETNEEPAWDTEYFQHPGIAITVGVGSGGYQANGVN
ncbi:MAG TPA: hypothetical protein VHY31_07260 [Streptosporangiaceae bacterium]|nr:hypothetical protein [Streptosporangiaceae bacterium]